MRALTMVLAVIGAASLAALAIFTWRIAIAPVGCEVTGTPIRFAAPESPEAAANKALVLDFYKRVIIGGALDQAATYIRPDYIQHNPNAGQGLDGFLAFFKNLQKRVQDMGATRRGEITLAIAEGDLVLINVTTRIDGPFAAGFREIGRAHV